MIGHQDQTTRTTNKQLSTFNQDDKKMVCFSRLITSNPATRKLGDTNNHLLLVGEWIRTEFCHSEHFNVNQADYPKNKHRPTWRWVKILGALVYHHQPLYSSYSCSLMVNDGTPSRVMIPHNSRSSSYHDPSLIMGKELTILLPGLLIKQWTICMSSSCHYSCWHKIAG